MAHLAVIVGSSVIILYGAIRIARWCRDICLTLAAVPLSRPLSVAPIPRESMVMVPEPVVHPMPAATISSAPLPSAPGAPVEEEAIPQAEMPPGSSSLIVEPEISASPLFAQSVFFFEDYEDYVEEKATLPQMEVWDWRRSKPTHFVNEDSPRTPPARRILMAKAESPAFVERGFSAEAAMDPIDGTALVPGEPMTPCSCGLVYRRESVEWLTANMDGSCVQCGESLKTLDTTCLASQK